MQLQVEATAENPVKLWALQAASPFLGRRFLRLLDLHKDGGCLSQESLDTPHLSSMHTCDGFWSQSPQLGNFKKVQATVHVSDIDLMDMDPIPAPR